ncbi:MAG: hypothetical protein KAS69_04075 [Planctomycetes bacterium]|nr:hypothetical protein [Planctomycetota bacterium]
MKIGNVKLFAVSCAVCIIVIFTFGCEQKSSTQKISIDTVDQKLQLKAELEQYKSENEQLKEQLEILTDLPKNVRLETLHNLTRVKMTNYTNLYDKDKDGKFETLIVYIQPLDDDGDAVKAAGTVDVQLWNLNKTEGNALIGQWRVEPEELKKNWFATLLTINYRLTFDVSDKIESFNEPLTVKAIFTDYLSGKVFNEQKVIKP